MDASDVEKAERFGRRRARIMAVQAIFFISWQALFITNQTEDRVRAVDQFRVSAWMVWSIALLVLLATGGGLITARKVRPILEDELTRSHRRQAYVHGFWAAVISAIGLYALDMVESVTAREAIHVIVSAAIGAALLTFSVLDRRSRTMTD
jgi:hypothetical protein